MKEIYLSMSQADTVRQLLAETLASRAASGHMIGNDGVEVTWCALGENENAVCIEVPGDELAAKS